MTLPFGIIKSTCRTLAQAIEKDKAGLEARVAELEAQLAAAGAQLLQPQPSAAVL